MSIIFVNDAKRLRAINELKNEARIANVGVKNFVAPEPTEERIKELYLRYGGLIRESVDDPIVPTVEERVAKLEDVVIPKVEGEGDQSPVEEKHRGRSSKKSE